MLEAIRFNNTLSKGRASSFLMTIKTKAFDVINAWSIRHSWRSTCAHKHQTNYQVEHGWLTIHILINCNKKKLTKANSFRYCMMNTVFGFRLSSSNEMFNFFSRTKRALCSFIRCVSAGNENALFKWKKFHCCITSFFSLSRFFSSSVGCMPYRFWSAVVIFRWYSSNCL